MSERQPYVHRPGRTAWLVTMVFATTALVSIAFAPQWVVQAEISVFMVGLWLFQRRAEPWRDHTALVMALAAAVVALYFLAKS